MCRRRGDMRETALTSLRARLRAWGTQQSGGLTCRWRRCSASPANPSPPSIDCAPSPTALIALKLGTNIEQWSYNATPANQDTAMSRSLSITPKPYYSSPSQCSLSMRGYFGLKQSTPPMGPSAVTSTPQRRTTPDVKCQVAMPRSECL